MKRSKDVSFKARLIDLSILLVLAIAALYTGPVTRRYEIETDKVQSDIKIAVVADLHSQYFGEDQKKLISRLQKEDPDIILMHGDMTNSPYDSEAMISFMEQAVEIAPSYYVIGNHEYWSYQADKVFEIVSETGVTILRHEHINLDINGNIIELYGIDDVDADRFDADYNATKWAEYLDNMWTENDDNRFRLLMSHRPERVEQYKKYEYDLITAGHAHGGQVRIPFLLNGLYAPDQGWFPKYAGGEYQLNDATTMIVSRGLYNYRFIPRVFNPSEIVIVTVTPIKNEE